MAGAGPDGPRVEQTPIPGLLVVRLPVHGDARGWFKEGWQREKMTALGLPDFGPVQHNVSFNAARGATRGIHAEPWDKFVTVVTGRAFGAWVDLRAGATFATTYTLEMDESVAVFVPRGVGNSYQALADATVYSYLVNDHWRPGHRYPAVDAADPTLALPWPIPLDGPDAELSDKDRANPAVTDVVPVQPRGILITGADGQLGRALADAFPGATLAGHPSTGSGHRPSTGSGQRPSTGSGQRPSTGSGQRLDLTDEDALAAWPWADYDVVLNAAAATAVDDAETPEGRRVAWATNARAPAALARIAARHRLTLVHFSSDYVFDGEQVAGGRREDDPLAPLGVYGQSKAAGDVAVAAAPRHYLIRTSWVVGDGHNFVRTMRRLAADGVTPSVVADQVGRLTFTDELARATRHLLDSGAPYGTYHVTNGGEPRSWAGYARRVFEHGGRDPADVTAVSTEEYGAGRALAPRPRCSVLALDKLVATGFRPADADQALAEHLDRLARVERA